ncbi:response regulator [Olleya sp. HaHaR_3_96]|uniref:response regulator n=1 Tax=Olleya sp. HaHaR_3_96 TaxID=2745560 RepID=UPI001C4F9EF2|nr:response regulator [Olleya sp. HaHaR_3_96]QXP60355.1 response regulator [Olleya sp. HaHaR_3_96]
MSKKILLVHSDPGVSFLLKKMLHLPNIDFVIKRTYEEVAAAISNTHYDVILTDAAINGNFLLQYIEDLKLIAPKAHIIVMSHMDQYSIKVSLEEMGVNDFISLPVNFPKAKALISNYI